MTDDALAAGYLRRLRRAARPLPRARRKELVDEIAAHIAEARATGAVPLRAVLDELGDPAEIAAAAGAGQRADRLGWQEIAAVILLLAGGFIFVAGWFAGLVLLWSSPRWRWPDKLLGTLVWPGGYAGVLLVGAFATVSGGGQVCGGPVGKPMTCTSTGSGGLPAWAGIALLVVALGAPAAVAIRLAITGRRVAHPAEPQILEDAAG
jgi:hypothetical protein